MSDLVTVERSGDAFWIGLNRPDKRNALDRTMVEQIADALNDARREPCVVVIHSTTPGIFASGVDLSEILQRRADDALSAINARLFDQIEAHRWPTLALIDGPALGGGNELALACDFRIGTAATRFAQPELALGIIAGAGGYWRLAQTVGLQVARRMLLLGQVLSAEQALAAGLLDEVVPDLTVRGKEIAASIASRSWRAIELTKLALRSQRMATTTFDITAQALLFDSEDKQTRITQFLDRPKRPRSENSP